MDSIGNGWIEISNESDLPSSDLYDWVLVKKLLLPEGFYGVPSIAEYRNGQWLDECGGNIEESRGVRVTHWRPIPED